MGHGLKLDSFIGLKELRVYDNSGFPDEVSGVIVEVGVSLDEFNDFDEGKEELTISTVVKRLKVFLDIWQLHKINYGFR